MANQKSLEDKADAAAGAGNFLLARSLLEEAANGDSSVELWTKLSAMRKAAGDLPGALAAIDRGLARSPLDFAALLSRAVILEQLRDARAPEEYGNALAQIRADQDVPVHFRSAVAHARRIRDQWRERLAQQLTQSLPQDLQVSERARAQRFVTNRARITRHYHQEPTDFHYPGLPEVEFFDRVLFPALNTLEQATTTIRDEFQSLIAAEAAEVVPYIQYPDRVPMRQWKELNHNRKWSAIHLLQNGQRQEANAHHCPKTLEAIAQMDQPHVTGASPNAMFSLLSPRTRIPPHTGVANTRAICHLPLIVPPNCGFRVGETSRGWTVGEAFVFDDTIEHEAWNDSDELRVVLIIDLWAPALSEGDRRAVAAVIGGSGVGFGAGA